MTPSRSSTPWYARIPIVGPLLLEALRPGEARFRRYHDREDRPRRVRTQIYALLTLLAGGCYLYWSVAHLNPDYPGWSALFLSLEAASLGIFALAAAQFWRLRFKPPEGIGPPGKSYSVDVFVTTCGEPMEVVRPTLEAASRLHHEGPLRVHVLDDGASDPVRRLAGELGFEYHSRPRAGVETEDAKGGNLNFGLERTDGDLILVVDADQVVRPDAVSTLASYMRFEDLAFVQSRQMYEVPEGDPFNNQDPVFYEAVQLGLDNENIVISCGSGVLYRREALEDVGGFATWNLVEDLTTSYELHARGWKTFYHPHALSYGRAPQGILGTYRQRGQWCLDAMRLFFWDNPLFKSGLHLKGRLGYLLINLAYVFTGLIVPLFFLIPIWSLLAGAAPITGPYWEFVVVRGLYAAAMVVAVHHMFRGRSPGKQFQMQVSLFPVYVVSILRALLHPPGRKPGYRVNLAEGARSRAGPVWAQLLAVSPQALLFLVHAVLPFYAVMARTASPPLIAGNAIVSAFVLWTLWPVFEAPARAREEEPRVSARPLLEVGEGAQ